MNCVGCGFEVQPGFAYCPKCGEKQPAACASCGYPCAPDFAFCPKCGARTGAAEASRPREALPQAAEAERVYRPAAADDHAEADRRTVTVLFADLSGFTALSEKLDPEVMQSLQNRLFEELTAAVEGFGGFVDKFIGDALLALFGAPFAHEDDPERALRAALDMIQRTARLSETVEAPAGLPLLIHVGVNTGLVVTGGFGVGAAKSYSVTGDTVNVAQRLQSLGGPGEILVGPLTHSLTRHAFSFQSLGDVALRGKAGSVLVHRLVGPLATPRGARGLEALGLGTPLIGRDAELDRMLAGLDLACGGQAQLMRLVGEAGIGKSRLVNEFLARVGCEDRFSSVVVRQYGCSSLGEQSYGVIGAVVRGAAAITSKETPGDMQLKLAALLTELGLAGEDADRLMPLLYHVLGLDDPEKALRHVEPEQLRRQVLFAVRAIIERRLALSPLLIIVEDLHWADAVSIEALRFVMDRLERTRLMPAGDRKSARNRRKQSRQSPRPWS